MRRIRSQLNGELQYMLHNTTRRVLSFRKATLTAGLLAAMVDLGGIYGPEAAKLEFAR